MVMTGASSLAPIPLRVAVGTVLMYHGYQKVFVKDFSGFIEFVKGLGVPSPEIMAHVAAWGELAGGALLILGFVTRFAALINAGTMAVAVWMVHLQGDDLLLAIQNNLSGEQGYELAFVLLASCLTLLLTGAGSLSVDSLLTSRRTVQ